MHLSIVIPAYNEQDNIAQLVPQLVTVLTQLNRSFEIIVIDDGSTDNTFDVLKKLHQIYKQLTIIRFRKNFGQTAALSAGFKQSRGEVIITLDADLQNDPEDIPVLLEQIEQGHDVISGWRRDRKDTFLNRVLPSLIANKLISVITGIHLHDYGCALKAYRREVLQDVGLYGELHRFLPALASWSGASIAEIPVKHHPRRSGKSNYGLGRTYRVLLDLITVKFLMSFQTQPIHVFGAFGFGSFLLGLLSLIITLYLKMSMNFDLTGNPLLYASILFFFTATQFILMGLLAEMMSRTYFESAHKPTYAIESLLEHNPQSE
ncbi:glycosyltransferase family 2 protein [bacterium]|nr:glycosyltransferase family 2 protein [bacterium]